MKSALDKARDHAGTDQASRANEWWAYVWHELRREEKENKQLTDAGAALARSSNGPGPLGGGRSVGDAAGLAGLAAAREREDAAMVQIVAMRENLRNHAIEISSLRQVRSQIRVDQFYNAVCKKRCFCVLT